MVPKILRQKILFQWITGISRDNIAKNNGISAGKVSGIAEDYRRNDSDFDMMRDYVKCIMKYGYKIGELVEVNRLFKRLQLLKIIPEQLELFLDRIAEHAFKRGLEPEVLIEKVLEVSTLAEKTNVPIEELPSNIERMSKRLRKLEKKIILKNIEADNVQRNLNVIVTRYRNIKALDEKVQLYTRAFATVLIERNNAYLEVFRLRSILNARGFA
jgi:hypothetical protein